MKEAMRIIDILLFAAMFVSILFSWNQYLQLGLCAAVAVLSAYLNKSHKKD